MIELANWLRQHIPLEDSSGATSGLVHGDFRIDNLVFHPSEVQYFKSLHRFKHLSLSNLILEFVISFSHPL